MLCSQVSTGVAMKLKVILVLLLLPILAFASTQNSYMKPGHYKCQKVISETPSGQTLEAESSEELSIEQVNGQNIKFKLDEFSAAISDDCKYLSQEDSETKARCNPSLSQVAFTRTSGSDETKATSILLFMQSGSKVIVADTTHVVKPTHKGLGKTTKMICSLK